VEARLMGPWLLVNLTGVLLLAFAVAARRTSPTRSLSTGVPKRDGGPMRRDELLAALYNLCAAVGELDHWHDVRRETLVSFEQVAPRPRQEAVEWLRRALSTLQA
jgi:hypothetical protein